MLGNYYRQTKDKDFVSLYTGIADGILGFFDRMIREKGGHYEYALLGFLRLGSHVALDREYSSIKAVGCEAELDKSTVRIKGEILPYGMVAFELSV